jgi:hypothetical protein
VHREHADLADIGLEACFVDAEAIAEALERKNMRFVPIKTDDQLI